MKEAYPVTETIERRRSVRTYEDRRLDPETVDKLKSYIRGLSNPFGAEVRVAVAEKSIDGAGEKLGTYGVIRGATTFLGLSAAPGPRALLGAGFEFEDLVLYATSLGLGTVWLAATFSRQRFQRAMDIPDDWLFPAISPVGYPEEKRLFERLMRKTMGADKRKPWRELFFDGDFLTPLTPERAGRAATALEMVRLAPSATNAQPWRVLKDGDVFHFFETHKAKSRPDDVLIKQVDLGIALFHFFKTLQAQDLAPAFSFEQPAEVEMPADYHYVATCRLS